MDWSAITTETSPSLLPARMDLFFVRGCEQSAYDDSIRSQLRMFNLFECKSFDEYLDRDAFLQMREYSTKLLRNLLTQKKVTDASEIVGFFTTFHDPSSFNDWLQARGYQVTKASNGIFVADKKDSEIEPKLVIISLRDVNPDVYPTLRLIAPGLTTQTAQHVLERAAEEVGEGEIQKEIMQTIMLGFSEADPETFKALMEVNNKVTLQALNEVANDAARKLTKEYKARAELLETNYNQLETNYNQLETDYTQLEINYNQAKEKLRQAEEEIMRLTTLAGQTQEQQNLHTEEQDTRPS